MTHAVALVILAQLSPQPTSRAIHQDGSGWRCDYSFRHHGPDPLTIHPSDISARLASPGLSNSRAAVPDRPAAHAIPRPVAHAIDGSARSSVVTLVDGGGDDARRCREKAVVVLWADGGEMPGEESGPAPFVVPPGGTLCVRVILRHEHEGNDGLDPLLGRRELTLKVGPWCYRDAIDLSSEQYTNMPEPSWSPMDAVPVGHRDDGIFSSPPYSLVLDADEPGMQYFRWPERRVRGGVRMRLRFRYLIPVGLDGEVKVRVAQYRESPNAWKVLSEGGFERQLPMPVDGKPSKNGTPGEKAVARWRLWDEVFVTQPEATTVAVDVRISGADSGLAWIDDMSLDYVGGGTNGPTAP